MIVCCSSCNHSVNSCLDGFVPETITETGDSVRVLIISTFTLRPGTLVDVRVIGVIQMADEKGPDQKILAVVNSDPRSAELLNIDNVPAHRKKEIMHFFKTYKDLEATKFVEMREFGDRDAAYKLITEAHERYIRVKSGGTHPTEGTAAAPIEAQKSVE